MSALTVQLSDVDVQRIGAAVAARLTGPQPDQMLTLSEASREARLSVRTLSRMISTGRLRAAKMGAGRSCRVLIRRGALMAALGDA